MGEKGKKLNLFDSFSMVKDHFAPKIIGEVNDVYVKIARIKGEEIPWHNHPEEDEMFYVLEGDLLMEIADQGSFSMNVGDIYIVPRGINHRVSAAEECKIMLIEKKTTAHTGDVVADVTKSIDQQK